MLMAAFRVIVRRMPDPRDIKDMSQNIRHLADSQEKEVNYRRALAMSVAHLYGLNREPLPKHLLEGIDIAGVDTGKSP